MRIVPSSRRAGTRDAGSADGRPGRRARTGISLAIASAAALGLAACGGDEAPEERLADAEQAVQEAVRETKLAHHDVERLRARVDTRESELAQAERELARAQAELLAATERAEERVGDVALFRTLQREMLEDERLETAAVRVSVEGRRVTLQGEVDSKAQAERALEIARSGFGVAGVTNELRVVGAQE
ncbi:MAG: BON domain-containing protein [Myxococcales bacterium]|nr:BON domain-containing protein [Myxococcales bacterium]